MTPPATTALQRPKMMGLVLTPMPNLDCDGNCLNDVDVDGICDEDEVDGCTDAGACNFDGDCNRRRMVLVSTQLALVVRLQRLVTTTMQPRLTMVLACIAVEPCETCNPDGTVNPNDDDEDGVCNADETEGCTDPAACNDGPLYGHRQQLVRVSN